MNTFRCPGCSGMQFMDLSRNGDYKLVVACRSKMLKVRERVIESCNRLLLLRVDAHPSQGTKPPPSSFWIVTANA